MAYLSTDLDLIAVGDQVRITRDRSELARAGVALDVAGATGIVDRQGEGAFVRVSLRGGGRAYIPTALVKRIGRRPA